VWIRVIQSIDSQRTEYVLPTSLPSMESTAVPGGSTPGGGVAALSEQPLIISAAAATVQTPLLTSGT
jgi:hypothetical protein